MREATWGELTHARSGTRCSAVASTRSGHAPWARRSCYHPLMRGIAWSLTLALGIAGGTACFTEAAHQGGCTSGAEGCVCPVDAGCDEGLECRSGYCVSPDCIAGYHRCSCDQGACQDGLECIQGAICLEPGQGTGSGSAAAGTSTEAATTSGATNGSDATTLPTGLTTLTTTGTDAGTDTGVLPGECSGPDECAGDEFCDFEDNLCGTVLPGTCSPRPDPRTCQDRAKKSCGCDDTAYSSACGAHAAGTDVNSGPTANCP